MVWNVGKDYELAATSLSSVRPWPTASKSEIYGDGDGEKCDGEVRPAMPGFERVGVYVVHSRGRRQEPLARFFAVALGNEQIVRTTHLLSEMTALLQDAGAAPALTDEDDMA